MTNQHNTAIVYVRVSRVGKRDRDSGRYQTEAEQEERCRAFATAKGYTVSEVISDVDASGGSWDRKGLDRVLALARAGKASAVIVYRLSRLGRSLRGVLETVESLQAVGASLMSVNEGVDLSSASGRLIFNVLASFDEYERELRSEYWDATKARAHARGVLVGPTPYGYQRVVDGPLAGRLEPHPERSAVVQAMYRERAAGATLISLTELMDRMDPRENGNHWASSQAHRIITSRVYVGEIAREGDIIEDAHPAIVSKSEWHAAQWVKGYTASKRRGSQTFLLAGVAKCESCGANMSGQLTGGADRQTPVYRCTGRSANGKCPAPAVIVAKRLDPYITEIAARQMRSMKAVAGAPTEALAAELAAVEDRLAETRAERREWVTDPEIRRAIGGTEWQTGLDVRNADLLALEQQAETLRAKSTTTDTVLTVDDVLANHELLRGALRGFIAGVYVRRGRGLAVEDRVRIDWL